MSTKRKNVESIIIERTKGCWIGNKKTFLGGADRRYWLPNMTQIEALLLACPIGLQKTTSDVFDCDDYALTLKSRMSFYALRHPEQSGGLPLAGGLFWGHPDWNDNKAHAANWILNANKQLVYIEPQFNNASSQSKGRKPIRRNAKVIGLRLIIF